MSFHLKDGSVYEHDLPLAHGIIAAESSFKFTPYKVIANLVKAKPIEWRNLLSAQSEDGEFVPRPNVKGKGEIMLDSWSWL